MKCNIISNIVVIKIIPILSSIVFFFLALFHTLNKPMLFCFLNAFFSYSQDDKKFYQLELVNRETGFNKVFNSSANVGVINPLIKVRGFTADAWAPQAASSAGQPVLFLLSSSFGARWPSYSTPTLWKPYESYWVSFTGVCPLVNPLSAHSNTLRPKASCQVTHAVGCVQHVHANESSCTTSHTGAKCCGLQGESDFSTRLEESLVIAFSFYFMHDTET